MSDNATSLSLGDLLTWELLGRPLLRGHATFYLWHPIQREAVQDKMGRITDYIVVVSNLPVGVGDGHGKNVTLSRFLQSDLEIPNDLVQFAKTSISQI